MPIRTGSSSPRRLILLDGLCNAIRHYTYIVKDSQCGYHHQKPTSLPSLRVSVVQLFLLLTAAEDRARVRAHPQNAQALGFVHLCIVAARAAVDYFTLEASFIYKALHNDPFSGGLAIVAATIS